MHLDVPSNIACHPFAINVDQALCSVVDTTWDQIKLVMEEGVLEECLQALDCVMVKQLHRRLGRLCRLHDTILPLGATGEDSIKLRSCFAIRNEIERLFICVFIFMLSKAKLDVY